MAGAVELEAQRNDTSAVVQALAYTELMLPVPVAGDPVLLNVAALERGLGTGGLALVIAVLGPDIPWPPAAPRRPAIRSGSSLCWWRWPGRTSRARLTTSCWTRTRWPAWPARDRGRLASSLAPALLAVQHDRPGTRLVYVMTDQARSTLAFSRSVAEARAAGLLAGTVTVGQAFGGDLEAVTVHSGLLAASLALDADVVVVTQGPGNLGTGTRWGFSGVAAGEAVNAAATLGGRPVGALRISGADARPRHRGVSHHSLTAYRRVALCPCDIAVPDFADDPALSGLVGAEDLSGFGRHRLVQVTWTGCGRSWRTHRCGCPAWAGPGGDPAYFLAAAAAGRHAAALLAGVNPPR